MFNKLIIILIMFSFLLTNFAYAQIPIEAPKTPEETRELDYQAFDITEKEASRALEQAWKEKIVPIWQSTWQWLGDIWNIHILPKIEALWQKAQELIGKEAKERKPIIEKEIKREVEGVKGELPTIWEKLKELIR